jgi:hypothetical protein
MVHSMLWGEPSILALPIRFSARHDEEEEDGNAQIARKILFNARN